MNTTLKLAILDRSTQTEVAKKAGLSESRLSRIIRGHYAPTDDEKKALARVLRKPVHELFGAVA